MTMRRTSSRAEVGASRAGSGVWGQPPWHLRVWAGILVKKIRLFGEEWLWTDEGIRGQSGLASQGFECVARWQASPPFNPRNHFLGHITGGGQLFLCDAIPLSPLSKRVKRKWLVLSSRPARHARQHIPTGHTSTRKKYDLLTKNMTMGYI
jgi:hypothetical protein